VATGWKTSWTTGLARNRDPRAFRRRMVLQVATGPLSILFIFEGWGRGLRGGEGSEHRDLAGWTNWWIEWIGRVRRFLEAWIVCI